ncbi:MAG: sigma-E factor negative regulatory protein [Chromatiales bacterium]|nr:sigma-E factor negative regulatory protein [Chromatiales bacterium]
MKTNPNELLSALVDGELGARETDEILAQMRSDAELQGTWERFQWIGDAIRNNLPESVPVGKEADIAARVSVALADEPAILAPAALDADKPRSRFRPLVGVAVAASVAGLAVMGLRAMTQDGNQGPLALQGTPVVMQEPIKVGRMPESLEPAQRSRLTRYLVSHYENAPNGGMKGMLPYVSVVGYNGR